MVIVQTEQLPPGVLSRSVVAVNFDPNPSLLVGMGDGSVISYSFSWNGSAVSSFVQTNKFSIGAQAVQLCPFQSKDSVHVFACCDRPAVFYGQSGKIMYSNVGMKDIHHMCSFRCANCNGIRCCNFPFHAHRSAVDFPGCLAMASPSTLTIGLIDEVQRLHVRNP